MLTIERLESTNILMTDFEESKPWTLFDSRERVVHVAITKVEDNESRKRKGKRGRKIIKRRMDEG